MATERGMRIRLGMFVLISLVLLGVLVLLFGTYPAVFKRHTEYTVVFSETPGIAPGAPVRRSGVRIGEVKDLSLDDETGQVSVRISVEKPHTLRHSDQPTIVTSLLGGDSTIDFLPRKAEPDRPSPDRSPVQPEEILVGVRQANVNTLLGQASDLVPTTEEVMKDIRDSLKRLEKLGPVTEDTLKEYQKLAKDSREAIPELRKTNDEIQTTARNWGKLGERLDLLLQTNQDKIVKVVDNTNDVLNRLSAVLSDENQRNVNATLKNVKTSSDSLPGMTKNFDEAIKNLNSTLTQTEDLLANLQAITKPLAGRSANIAKNLDETTEKLNKVLTDAQRLFTSVGEGDGTLRRFINDPSLYNHLDEAACQLMKIMPRLDRVLKDAEVFADKIARHPELIGAGGAIRPSSGIKEAPTGVVPSSSFKPLH